MRKRRSTNLETDPRRAREKGERPLAPTMIEFAFCDSAYEQIPSLRDEGPPTKVLVKKEQFLWNQRERIKRKH